MKSTNLELLKEYYHENMPSHPILFINLFAHETVATQQRVYELLREKIHLSFLEHVYLTTSRTLDAREREICEKWCSLRFIEMTNHAVSVGLTHLSRSLSKHWNCSVTLLIDDYDSIIMNALHSANSLEFKLILQLMYGQISKLVKYNDFVEKVLITGESFLAGSELASKNDLEIYRFLGDHSIVKYFGLNGLQIEEALSKLNINTIVADDVHNWYGGYTSKHNLTVHNPFSVYSFLKCGTLKSYWRQNRHVNSLARFFQITFVEESIKAMLRYECAPISLLERANVDDLTTLKLFLENIPESAYHEYMHDIFFTYLFDQGYLSFGKNKSSCIIIPNLEVERALSQTLKQHYVLKHKLNPYRLEECAKSINNLYSHVYDSRGCLKDIMNTFFKSLEGLFHDYRDYHGIEISSEEDLTEILIALANCAPNFVTKSKLKMDYLDENNKTRKSNVDLYIYSGSFAIIIELSHAKTKSPNSKLALQRILDREYYNILQNKLYTPNKIDHSLFVGLSTNNKAVTSISCLLDSKNITEAITIRKIHKLPLKSNTNFTRKKKFPSRRKNGMSTTISPIETINSTESSDE